MDNCVKTSQKLLTFFGVRYTNQYLEDCILSHPEHPSLLCIADTLEKYGIENLAVRVGEEKLSTFPLPCIVQLTHRGGPFWVLTEFSDDKVVCFGDSVEQLELTKKNFLDSWTGVCLLTQASENSGEPNIIRRLKEKRTMTILGWSIIILLFITLVSTMFKSTMTSGPDTLFLITYTLLKLVGLSMGFMLLWYEVDQFNPTLQNFCSGGKKINCDAVLSSKYATVFNGSLSLGLLVFTYFFGTLSFLWATGFSSSSLSVLAILSFSALPAVLLSIYYQGVVIKSWCKFCIIVQVVLILEMTSAYLGNFYGTSIKLETLPLLLAILLIPIFSWKWLKPFMEAKKETNLYKRGLKKLKNNTSVFHGLLTKSEKFETSTKGLGISISNDQAKYDIVKICNPYCGPCSKSHILLEKLVERKKINLQILFNASTDDKDRKHKPVSHFLAIAAKGDDNLTLKALDDWYRAEKKDYEAFSKNFAMNGELEKQKEKIKAMYQWCQKQKISHTPTIFINGYQLPREYTVEDLGELLD